MQTEAFEQFFCVWFLGSEPLHSFLHQCSSTTSLSHSPPMVPRRSAFQFLPLLRVESVSSAHLNPNSQFIFRNTKPKSFSLFITYQASLTLINHLIRQRGCKRSLHHVSLLDLDPAIEQDSHGKASVSSPRALGPRIWTFY